MDQDGGLMDTLAQFIGAFMQTKAKRPTLNQETDLQNTMNDQGVMPQEQHSILSRIFQNTK